MSEFPAELPVPEHRERIYNIYAYKYTRRTASGLAVMPVERIDAFVRIIDAGGLWNPVWVKLFEGQKKTSRLPPLLETPISSKYMYTYTSFERRPHESRFHIVDIVRRDLTDSRSVGSGRSS